MTQATAWKGHRTCRPSAAAGLPGVDVSICSVVLVPSGTPAIIVKKLNADIAQVVADPEFRQALALRGFDAISSSPEQLAQFLDKDYVKFRDLIMKLSLQVEMRTHADMHRR